MSIYDTIQDQTGSFELARELRLPAMETLALCELAVLDPGTADEALDSLRMHGGDLDAGIDVLRRRLDDPGLGTRHRQVLLFS